jgi:CheY-like chemotaxis protein
MFFNSAQAISDLKNMHVLIIEDDASSAAYAKESILQLGMSCDICSHVDQALKYHTIVQYDCVLLDLMLPEKDGHEYLRIKNATPAIKNIPVIAITSITNKQERERCYSEGISGYITKPYHWKEVAERLLGA